MEYEEESGQFPVFKGLGRKPTFMGVPTNLLLGSFCVVAMLAMMISLKLWVLLFVVFAVLSVMTREDDKAFDVLFLEFKTRRLNRNKKFWGGSSYAQQEYNNKRPWMQPIIKR